VLDNFFTAGGKDQQEQEEVNMYIGDRFSNAQAFLFLPALFS
jgi:hypothetical protein